MDDLVSLHDGIDPPADRLPDPIWLNISPEEYERLMTVSFPGSIRRYITREQAEKRWPK